MTKFLSTDNDANGSDTGRGFDNSSPHIYVQAALVIE